MSGSQIKVALTQIEKQRLGYMAISLSNFDNDLECKIQAESKVEIENSLFTFDAEEALTGWTGIGNDNDVYMKLVVSGDTVTAVFTTVAPIWNDAKYGFYNGSDRYLGGLYKDSSGNYSYKWMYNYIPRGEGNLTDIGEVISSIIKEKSGCLWCNGLIISNVSDPDYSGLIYLLKKEAGVDSGHPYYHADSDKATLPDLRGAAARGVDIVVNRDKDGVRKSGNYQVDKVLNHKHGIGDGEHHHLLNTEDMSTIELTADHAVSESGVQGIYSQILKATSLTPTVGKSGTMVGGSGTIETGDPNSIGATENIMKNIALYYLVRY